MLSAYLGSRGLDYAGLAAGVGFLGGGFGCLFATVPLHSIFILTD